MSSALKWGLITGMVLIVQSLISAVLGVGTDPSMSPFVGLLISAIGIVVTFITIYLGIKDIRDNELNGYLTMGEAIRKGLKIALIAGTILGVYSIIYSKLIDPGMMDRIMAAAEEQWQERNMSEEQMDVARKMMSIFKNPFLIAAFTIISTCFWGLIQSLIAGAMLKKEAPPSFPSPPPSVPSV